MANYQSQFTGEQIDTAIGKVDGKLDKTGGTLSGNLLPQSYGTYTLGTTAYPFSSVHAKNGVFASLMPDNTTSVIGNSSNPFYGAYFNSVNATNGAFTNLTVSDVEVKDFIVSREINTTSTSVKYVKTTYNSGYVEIDLWTPEATITFSNTQIIMDSVTLPSDDFLPNTLTYINVHYGGAFPIVASLNDIYYNQYLRFNTRCVVETATKVNVTRYIKVCGYNT